MKKNNEDALKSKRSNSAFKPMDKNGFTLIVCIFATLLGALFIVIDLLVFLVANPRYESYVSYSRKIDEGLANQYSVLTQSGRITDEKKDELQSTYTELGFVQLTELRDSYDEANEKYAEKVKEYEEKYAEYSEDVAYVNAIFANYIAHKQALTSDNISDEQKEEIENKITEYENKRDGLADKLTALKNVNAELDTFSKECVEILIEIAETEQQYESDLGFAYKSKLYSNVSYEDESLTAYLQRCSQDLEEQFAAFVSAVNEYRTNKQAFNDVSNSYATWEEDYNEVYTLYQSATADMAKFVSDYVALDKEYETALAESKATDAELTDKLNRFKRVSAAFGLEAYHALLMKDSDKLTESDNDKIEEYSATVDLYQQMLDSGLWTVDYYVNYVENNKEDTDYNEKVSAFNVIKSAELELTNRLSEAQKIITGGFNLSNYAHEQYEARREGVEAYYASEQLLIRLNAAANLSILNVEKLNNFVGLVPKYLDWLTVNDDMRRTVLGDLSFEEFEKSITAFLKVYTSSTIEVSGFHEYDIDTIDLKGDEILDIESQVAVFNKFIEAYVKMTESVNAKQSQAHELSISYTVAPGVSTMVMIAVDSIVAAILLAYFTYAVSIKVKNNKAENE